MTNIIAKIRKEGKDFEITVDADKALALKKTGRGNVADMLLVPHIFLDTKKGFRASEADLQKEFKTADVYLISEKIIKEGILLLPVEYKTKAREEKLKQIIDYISRTCIDPRTSLPLTPQRIESAIKEAGVRIDENKSVEGQIDPILNTIQKILPIRVETKKIFIKIPATFAARVYGILKAFILKEEWTQDGSMELIIQLPKATQIDIYDKINNITHGATITKELG